MSSVNMLQSSLCPSVMYSPKPKCTLSSTDPVANSLTRDSKASLGSFYSWFSFWTLTAMITLASFLTSYAWAAWVESKKVIPFVSSQGK